MPGVRAWAQDAPPAPDDDEAGDQDQTSLADLSLEDLMRLDVATVSELEPVPRRKATADVTVVTRRDIELGGARTLADVLRAVPGVDVSIDNDGTVRPSIRGLDESADILLVVDGLRINDAVSGAAYYDLPAAFIERVEVLRGPASAIYGGNAILGVISVTTRTVDHAIAGARGGSFASGEGFLITNVSRGAWKLRSGIDFAETKGPDFVLARDALTASQPDVSEAGPNGRINARDERVIASFVAERQGGFQLSGLALEDDRGPYVGPLATLAREGDHASRFLGLSATLDRDVAENLRLFARASATSWRFEDTTVVEPPGWRSVGTAVDLDGDGLPEVFPDGQIERSRLADRDLSAEARVTSRTCRGDFTGGLALGHTLVTSSGFETNAVGNPTLFRLAFEDYSGETFPHVARWIAAPYAQWDDQILPWAAITAGARFDYVKDTGGATPIAARTSLSPRIALVLTPDDDTEVRVLYGGAFRAPTLRELDNPAGSALGNPQLLSETSQTGEVRVSRRFGKTYEAHAGGYLGTISDRIDVPLSTSTAGQNPYLNNPGTLIAGVEGEARARWTDDSAFVNAAFYRAVDRTLDFGLFRVATVQANGGGDVAVWDHLSIGGVAHLRGPRLPPTLTFFQRERLRNTQQPTSLVVDLIARSRGLPDGWWASIGVYNVLATDYREVPRDAFFLLDQPGGANALPAQPRMIMVELGKSL